MSAARTSTRSHTLPRRADHALRRVSLRVAMLVQQSSLDDEPASTDVMVYRQPASDVPVPCAWQPSRPAPFDPGTPSVDGAEKVDTIPRCADQPVSSAFDSAQMLHQAMSADARLYVWMCSGFVTCTLAAWVTLG